MISQERDQEQKQTDYHANQVRLAFDFDFDADDLSKSQVVNKVANRVQDIFECEKSLRNRIEQLSDNQNMVVTTNTGMISQRSLKNFKKLRSSLEIKRIKSISWKESRETCTSISLGDLKDSDGEDDEDYKEEDETDKSKQYYFLQLRYQIPSKKGFLCLKKNLNIFSRFKTRYCVLEDLRFSYYVNEDDIIPEGSLNLEAMQFKIEVERDPSSNSIIEFILKPLSMIRAFRFRCSYDSDHEGLESWLELIQLHIDKAGGTSQLYQNNNRIQHNYWLQNMITMKQFESECETGDLILFKNRGFRCTLQRTFTISEYDHVAMVVKQDDGGILLFESSSKKGVNLIPFKAIISSVNDPSHKLTKISFRKLIWEKSDIQMKQMSDFISNCLGSPFQLSIITILQNQADNTSYFCSQLIAACYQYCSILSKTIPSQHHFPVHFSSKKTLRFLNNAHLSQEFQVLIPQKHQPEE